MANLTTTKSILNWIYSTSFEDLPLNVRQLAKLAIYDTIGGMLACSLLPVAHRMTDFIKVLGGERDCSVIGFPFRTSVMNAALVNGTLGHADEVDIVEADGLGHHIMATCVGAALAAGQLAGTSGKEVIRAVVLGRELTKRINAVQSRSERDTGKTYGPIDASNTMGATATAGLALGLPLERMDVALTLAAMMTCGITLHTRESEHMAKAFLRGGVGAKNGVAAAVMANVAYDAPRDVFDGPQGFFQSRIGLEQVGQDFLTARDQDFGLGELNFKRYAAGSPNLAPRQALLDIMSENGLVAGDIANILAEVSARHLELVNVPYATFDGRRMLALAALHPGVGFREAYQKKVNTSPEATAMRERVKLKGREDWQGRKYQYHAAVTVETKDGRQFRNETDYRQMNEEDLDVKFSELVGLRAGAAKAQELAQILKQLDTLSNVAELMTKLELPETTIDQI